MLGRIMVIAAFALSIPAHADIVALHASGTVTGIEGAGPTYFPTVTIGQTFTVEFLLDTTLAIDVYPELSDYASYPAIIQSSIWVAGEQLVSFVPALPINRRQLVVNDIPGGPDQLSLQASTDAFPTGIEYYASLQYQGSEDMLGSDAFPAALPTTFFSSQFSFSRIAVADSVYQSDSFSRFIGSIDQATIAPVPLPAAAWLLLSGLGALGATGSRRIQRGASREQGV